VELAEYSLPVLSNQQPGRKGPQGSGMGKQASQSGQGRASSGVINATQLPPLGSRGHPQGIQEEMHDEMMEAMEAHMEEDPYGEEMEAMDEAMELEEQVDEGGATYDTLRDTIEKAEDAGKDQAAQAREANYISKGTYIGQLLGAIETGEQAIAFFAKHGSNTPIKFVNCKRKPVPGDQFRPYDLVKVDEDDEKALEGEYFTISAQGVVHVSQPEAHRRGALQDGPGFAPTEFLSLSEWMQQSTMFNVLTSMKFFKHYLIGKVFALWKGNVRFKMYNRTRQNLARNLIQTRPAFLSNFMDIQKTLYEMQSQKTYTVPKAGKPFELVRDFIELQKTNREAVKEHYNAKVDEIISKRLALLVAAVSASRTLKEEEDLEHAKMGQAAKHKSMVLQKQEDELKDRVLKLAKRNYHSLGTFIRLVDYMVVETQVKINQESADLILAEMGKERGKYGIQTTVDFDPEGHGMAFEPAQQEFVAQFDKLLQDMQSVTEEVVRVISHQDFRQFIHGLISDSGPRFRAIVEDSRAYATSKATIQRRIIQDFEHLQRAVEKCEQCADVNAFDQTFVFEDFKAEHSDLESIKAHLDRLQKWEGKISNNIKPLETKGLIWAQGRKLRERLSQRVKTEQGHMKEYLRELAERKARECSAGLQEIRTRLKDPASTLAAYVGYVTELELCRQRKD
jgi:dynein heavy chain